MGNITLIRRGSEILAALIIVAITIVYATKLQYAGNPNYLSARIATGDSADPDTMKGLAPSAADGEDILPSAPEALKQEAEKTVGNIVAAQTDSPALPEAAAPSASGTQIPVQTLEITTEPVYRYIQANELNIRSGPGVDYEKLGSLTRGARVQALVQQGEWLEIITADTIKGYILFEYTADSIPPVYKYITANQLNVRSGPDAETEKLTTLTKSVRVQVLEKQGGWLKIITADQVEGFILAQYTADSLPPVYNFINANQLNVRKGPSAETEKLATLTSGARVQVLEKQGEWVRIITSDKQEGYVLLKYVVAQVSLVSRGAAAAAYNADLTSKVLEYAKQFVGVPYVYGSSSSNGFDCSGYLQYVYKKFNIYLPRSSEEYANVGVNVSRTDIKPGDILLFDRYGNNALGHVGIYLGKDQFIHASTSKGKVIVMSLSGYNAKLLGIRRVIQ